MKRFRSTAQITRPQTQLRSLENTNTKQQRNKQRKQQTRWASGIGRCLSGREVEDVEELVLREDFAVEVGDAKTIVEVPSSPHVYTNIMELTVV